MKITETNYVELKKNYTDYLADSKTIGVFFGGPSLYFHNRSLAERKKDFLGNNHLELIYATLSAWGMHRMGDTKTKMVDFNIFKENILKHKDELTNLSSTGIETLNSNNFASITDRLKEICFALKLSESESKIVGNSKALAHILPDLIPPIDRQHTILFFQKEPTGFLNKKGKIKQPLLKENDEIGYFTHVMEKTFEFVNYVKYNPLVKIQEASLDAFNTSYPKIFDNLIISYIKSKVK